jgi:hypothetical protein
LRLSGIYNNQNLIVMQTSTKVVKSSKKQTPIMSQKQLDAIEHLKLFVPDLPEDLVLNGNLNLSDTIINRLPDNLVVNGNLDLSECCYIDELPFNLTVNGNLTMDSSVNGMHLRPCTKIKGNFYKAWYNNIPENFTIGGDLIVGHISTLPAGLTVMGNLDLSNTKITELPERLKVYGNLNIQNLEIEELPKDLYVGGYLNASHTKLRLFPESVIVKGGFRINDTKIKKFPRQFSRIIGDVIISNTDIRTLPDNLTVVGGLYFDNTPISELPENLHVYGALSCGGTYVETLPASLKFEDSLYLEHCPIERLPENMMIKGSLNICESNITEFPEGLIVNGDLEFSDTLIKKMPQFMNVGGLHIDNTKITELPENFSVTGNLHVWYCDDKTVCLTKLPKGLKVGGSLRFSKNLYSRLPEGLFVGGDLDISDQDNIKSLPKDFNVKGILKLGRQWDIIRQFLVGNYAIDGTVEILHEEYKQASIALLYVKEEIKSRLSRDGAYVILAPAKKEAPANQDGGTLDAAPVKSKVLTEA